LGFPAPPWADVDEDMAAAETKRRGERVQEESAAARRWRRRRVESMGVGRRGRGRQDMARPRARAAGGAMRPLLTGDTSTPHSGGTGCRGVTALWAPSLIHTDGVQSSMEMCMFLRVSPTVLLKSSEILVSPLDFKYT
jgi:hypothetical protein